MAINLSELSQEELDATVAGLEVHAYRLIEQGFLPEQHWEFPAINKALDLVESEQHRRAKARRA